MNNQTTAVVYCELLWKIVVPWNERRRKAARAQWTGWGLSPNTGAHPAEDQKFDRLRTGNTNEVTERQLLGRD